MEVGREINPIAHFSVIDAMGDIHRPSSVGVVFTYEETCSIVPMEFHSYGDPEKGDRFGMSSVVLPFEESPFDISVTIVDKPDGTYTLTQSQKERS